MRRIAHLSAIAMIALLVGPATTVSALGDLPFQVLLEADGTGRIFMNDNSSPSWKACRPDLTACTPFAVGNFETGEAPPGTVFWAGGSLLTPVWKGTLRPTAPPSVSGEVRANYVVTPLAGQWAGGWEDDYDELTLAICKKATGENCLTVNHEGSERECGAAGATLIDPAFAGRYLRVTDHRYGSGTVFAGVGHPFYFRDREPVPGPTISVAVIGKIAPATGPPSVKCGPSPLIAGSISKAGSASVECRVVGCRAALIARRGRRAARLTHSIRPARGLAESPTVTFRFAPRAIRRLGKGPVRLALKINGKTVARRTVKGSLAASSASARVYAANCGTLSYLDYEPRTWSAGCTAGSPEVHPARWVRWSSRSARATGASYVENCDPSCAYPSHHATYPATVVLSRPARCTRGARLRYFSRAVWTITYPAGNPFHQRPGRHTSTFRPAPTTCQRGPGSR